MIRVLVTGATGFVGRSVIATLREKGYTVRAALRVADTEQVAGHANESVVVGDIASVDAWAPTLTGVDVVIHLAARVHVMRDQSADPISAYNRVNLLSTSCLAEQAAAAGVKRLVFASTAKVNGERTGGSKGGRATGYTEADTPHPEDPYAASKWEAEKALRCIEAETNLEVVVVRPPLVYGPGVKANFLALFRAVHHGIPLPLASVQNRRSFVGVTNLASFLTHCVEHPNAARETFLVSDGEDLSTPDLIRRIARSLGRPSRLIGLPESVLRRVARLVGREAAVQRLCESFVVDARKCRALLGWSPPLSVDKELAAIANWYLGCRVAEK